MCVCVVCFERSLKLDGARALLQLQCVVSHWTLMLVCLLHHSLSQAARKTSRLY